MVGVAQLVEPRIVDPVVVGSNPIVHPIMRLFSEQPLVPCTTGFGPLAQLVEQLTLNQLVVGSSPTRPTTLISQPHSFLGCRPLRTPLQISSCAGSDSGAVLHIVYGCFTVATMSCARILWFVVANHISTAKVAELVDALDLGSSGVTRGGSSPPFRTILARASKKWLYPRLHGCVRLDGFA